ncbi:MAG: hypothetical protein K2P99_07490 [Burkholderiales bacterium]|nr:hypothetical protein [Burkholderiales bacterium]
MTKNLFLILMACGFGFAVAEVASTTISAKKYSMSKDLNSPTAGSNQYSNGNFTDQGVIGKKGEVYHTKKQLSEAAGKTDISGSSSYSSRDKHHAKLTGKKGKKYYTKEELQYGQNKSTQGSKIGSNQLFNYPGEKGNYSTGK